MRPPGSTKRHQGRAAVPRDARIGVANHGPARGPREKEERDEHFEARDEPVGRAGHQEVVHEDGTRERRPVITEAPASSRFIVYRAGVLRASAFFVPDLLMYKTRRTPALYIRNA